VNKHQSDLQHDDRWIWALLVTAWICFLVPFPAFLPAGIFLNTLAFTLSVVEIMRGSPRGLQLTLASALLSGLVYALGQTLIGS